MGIIHTTFNNLSKDQKTLVSAAQKVMARAYNLYSSFYVGASVLTKSGNTFSSANMENSSYGLSVCAEVGAIQQALSAADPEITAIAICGGYKPDSGGLITTPCGRCRQLIYESGQIANTDIEVICANADLSSILVAKISDLLPYPFGPKDLKLDQEIDVLLNRIKNA